MGTYTDAPLRLYRPDLAEAGATWYSLVNANFTTLASLFAGGIMVHAGDVQTHDGMIQIYWVG